MRYGSGGARATNLEAALPTRCIIWHEEGKGGQWRIQAKDRACKGLIAMDGDCAKIGGVARGHRRGNEKAQLIGGDAIPLIGHAF